MKILISDYDQFAHHSIHLGLGRALTAVGHQVTMWNPSLKPALDAFDEFIPDLFIGQTFNTNKSIIKCLEEYPSCQCIMKASDWGTISDKIDRNKYPVLIANQKEIDILKELKDKTGKPDFLFVHYCDHRLQDTHGHWKKLGFQVESMLSGADVFSFTNGIFKPEFECDISFVGGRWQYKSITLDKWILPLCFPNSKYKVKIFGNQPWGIAQYGGFIPEEEIKNLFLSSKICPSVSELHSQDFGYDIIERSFKILSCKAFCISDSVEDLKKIIPEGIIYAKTSEDFFEKIAYYIDKPEKRQSIAKKGYKNVINNNTYFHRAAHMFNKLDRPDLAIQVMNKYTQEIIPKLGL